MGRSCPNRSVSFRVNYCPPLSPCGKLNLKSGFTVCRPSRAGDRHSALYGIARRTVASSRKSGVKISSCAKIFCFRHTLDAVAAQGPVYYSSYRPVTLLVPGAFPYLGGPMRFHSFPTMPNFRNIPANHGRFNLPRIFCCASGEPSLPRRVLSSRLFPSRSSCRILIPKDSQSFWPPL